jgi:hypothetical protein
MTSPVIKFNIKNDSIDSKSAINDLQLINLVKDNELIWDTGHKDYRNSSIRNTTWKWIAEQLDCKDNGKLFSGVHQFKSCALFHNTIATLMRTWLIRISIMKFPNFKIPPLFSSRILPQTMESAERTILYLLQKVPVDWPATKLGVL